MLYSLVGYIYWILGGDKISKVQPLPVRDAAFTDGAADRVYRAASHMRDQVVTRKALGVHATAEAEYNESYFFAKGEKKLHLEEYTFWQERWQSANHVKQITQRYISSAPAWKFMIPADPGVASRWTAEQEAHAPKEKHNEWA